MDFKCTNKMKNKANHTIGTIPISNIKIVERGKMDTPYTQMDTPYTQMDTPYTQMDTPYTQMDTPYTQMDTPYTQMDSRSMAWYRHFNKKWWS